MVVSTDTEDISEIISSNKRQKGERLAYMSLKRSYGRDNIIDVGPEIKEAVLINPGEVKLSFDYSKDLKFLSGNNTASFKLAAEDKPFEPADFIKVTNNEIILKSDKIKSPRFIS